MSNTREKLLEANYFLDQMRRCRTERESLKYNLSAFLSAARSITLFMQKEFSDIADFKTWFNSRQISMKNDPVMSFMNEKRVMTIHLEPVKPRALVKQNITATVHTVSSISIVVTRNDVTVEKRSTPADSPTKSSEQSENTQEWFWYFEEIKNKDVLTVCDEYLSKLEAM